MAETMGGDVPWEMFSPKLRISNLRRMASMSFRPNGENYLSQIGAGELHTALRQNTDVKHENTAAELGKKNKDLYRHLGRIARRSRQPSTPT